MAREFKGKITNIGQPTSGTTKNNEAWKQVEFVAEDSAQYPEKICFSFFAKGDKLKNVDNFIKYAKIDALVEVKFSIKTNEYQGKFYSKNEAFSVFLTKDSAEAPSQETSINEDPNSPF